MSSITGNQFWKNRTKHGRDKLFSSPEILLEEAYKYFEYCDANPLLEHDFVGKDATPVYREKNRVYTWSGLELFLGVYSLRDYKKNEEYKDFSQVITHIESIIYTNKFEGASANLFNANIISRDLGLANKEETKNENKNQEGAIINW